MSVSSNNPAPLSLHRFALLVRRLPDPAPTDPSPSQIHPQILPQSPLPSAHPCPNIDGLANDLAMRKNALKLERERCIAAFKAKNDNLSKSISDCIAEVDAMILKEREALQKELDAQREAIAAEAKRKADAEAKAQADAKAKADAMAKAAMTNTDPSSANTTPQQSLKTAIPQQQKSNSPLKNAIHSKEPSTGQAPANSSAPHIVSPSAWQWASPCLDAVTHISTVIEPKLKADPNLKDKLFKSRMVITQRIGQLTRSMSKVTQVAVSLNENIQNAISYSPDFGRYVMDLTAKQIVDQAETEVAVKTNTAFPLAVVCVMLYSKHQDFLNILLGRLMERCPYVVPRYLRKFENETVEQYNLKIGYKQGEDGTLETEIQYCERMCGIISLYAAIIQESQLPNAHGIQFGWAWMARILNMKPRRITPQLLHAFLQVSGHALITTYKRQAVKLVQYIIHTLAPQFSPSSVASSSRLGLFLQETVVATGKIPRFENSALEK